MKTKFQFKKIIFLLIVSTLLTFNVSGQDSYIKNRWNFKIGYARYKTGSYIFKGSERKAETVGNYRIEANYGLLNYLEVGAYFGYSKFEFFEITSSVDSIFSIKTKNYNTPFYGINLNFHIFPFLIKRDDFRFDLYVTGKYGGLFFTTPDYYYLHGHVHEFGIGGGFSFYIWKHLGLYIEYSYGKYHYEDNSNLRYGITLKF